MRRVLCEAISNCIGWTYNENCVLSDWYLVSQKQNMVSKKSRFRCKADLLSKKCGNSWHAWNRENVSFVVIRKILKSEGRWVKLLFQIIDLLAILFPHRLTSFSNLPILYWSEIVSVRLFIIAVIVVTAVVFFDVFDENAFLGFRGFTWKQMIGWTRGLLKTAFINCTYFGYFGN